MIDRSDLTKREIQKLPVILRICFHIQGWNHSANIETLSDWLEFFWGLFEPRDRFFTDYQGMSEEDAKKISQRIMLDKVDELARFLRDFCYTENDDMNLAFYLGLSPKDKKFYVENKDWYR